KHTLETKGNRRAGVHTGHNSNFPLGPSADRHVEQLHALRSNVTQAHCELTHSFKKHTYILINVHWLNGNEGREMLVKHIWSH
uniref:Uncharacterized protein n=1 Tax=Parascaris univalens TaxID=6257 RepID=A0A914ZZ34_PARUN